jgi:hypothetical protein
MKTKIKDTRFFIKMNILEDYLDVLNVYEKNKFLFKSKNDFLKICLHKGLQDVKKEISNIEKSSKERNLEEKDKSKINSKHFEVIIVLLSNIYEMLIGLSVGEPKTFSTIEKGWWDELPERFRKKYAIVLADE